MWCRARQHALSSSLDSPRRHVSYLTVHITYSHNRVGIGSCHRASGHSSPASRQGGHTAMDESRSINRRQFLKVAGGGFGMGGAVALGMNLRPIAAHARTLKIAGAKEVPSVCPYCAVGCGTLVSVKDGQIINIEGNPDNPINRGTLCPKGAASFQLTVNPLRST